MKYKLIKEYPGSPKLGSILLHKELQYCDWDEYYEKIVEKDYEILSYIHNGSKHIWKKDSQLKDCFCIENGKLPFIRLEDILKYPKVYLIYSIHSIKRLSDSEVFTIGDNIYANDLFITKFIIKNNTIEVESHDDCSVNNSELNEIVKFKQPLFTTEDGVDIFEGDCFCYLDTLLNLSELKTAKSYKEPNAMNLKFSIKQKAEEYIIYNKPCLSLNDFLNNIRYDSSFKTFIETNKHRFKELVKQKIITNK